MINQVFEGSVQALLEAAQYCMLSKKRRNSQLEFG